MSGKSTCYVARKPDCGCIVAAISFYPDDPRNAAKEIAQWIREGYRVEPSDGETVRAHFVGESHCPHKQPKPQPVLPGMED